MHFKIRELKEDDYPAAAEIYRQGIETGHATFQKNVPDYSGWDKAHHKFCRFGAFTDDGSLAGWIVLSPTVNRYPYRGVAEVSLYVGNQYKRHGIGLALMEEMNRQAGKYGIWTLESLIFRDNEASLRAHAKAGYREVGIRERIASDRNGVWHDTVIMEKRLPDEIVNFSYRAD